VEARRTFLAHARQPIPGSGWNLQLEAIGGLTGALIRVKAHNSMLSRTGFSLVSEVLSGWVMHNPAWVDAGKNRMRWLPASLTVRIESCCLWWVRRSFPWAE